MPPPLKWFDGWLERRFGPMGLSRVPLTNVPGEAIALCDDWARNGAGANWTSQQVADAVQGLGYRVEGNYIYPKELG